MSSPLRVILLITLVAGLGCATPPPLPPSDPPPDFLFIYTLERPEQTAAATGVSDKSEDGGPQKIHVAVDAAGEMDIEATFVNPHVTVEKTTHQLAPHQLRTLYDAVLQANLMTLPDEWEGEDRSVGRESWFVLGNARSRTISVSDCAVPELAGLRSTVHTYLPKLESSADSERARVVMDTRTMVFHAGADPDIAIIPIGSRKHFPHHWAALNAGGRPCPDFEAGE